MIKSRQQLLEVLYAASYAQKHPHATKGQILRHAARVEEQEIDYAQITEGLQGALSVILGDVYTLPPTETL